MNCDTHYGLCWKAEGPPRTSLFEREFKHVRSTWYDGLQVNIFDTSERFFLICRLSSLFLIRQQNEENHAFVLKARDFLF